MPHTNHLTQLGNLVGINLFSMKLLKNLEENFSYYQDYKIGVTSLFNMKSLLDKTYLLEKQKLHELTNI